MTTSIASALRRLAALSLLALLGAGCTPRYSTKPPLAFSEYPYQGPSGQPWPVQYAQLAETAQRASLSKPVRVAYVELNKGGPKGTLVFLHGLGSYLKFWYYQLDSFAAQGWHVVAIDLPGFGKSDKPGTFPYTMEALGDAAVELVGQLGVKQAIFVGHSMGGQTALSLAIRRPELVRALVLTDPAGFEFFSDREEEWFLKAFNRVLVLRASEYAIWGSIALQNFMRFRPELEWLVEERVRVVKTPEFEPYAYAQVRVVQGLVHNDFVRESLGKVKAPTFIVFGEDDRLIPNAFLHGGRARSVFEYGAAQIPGAKLQGIDNCGHSVQLDCPAEYGAAVESFLAGLPPR
jgi:pimeloyl-ACP methyl ester carboxylesterase